MTRNGTQESEPPRYLTKGLFELLANCPARAPFILQNWPMAKSEDADFHEHLAEGGRQFELLVRHRWPGEVLGGTSSTAASDTVRTLGALDTALRLGHGVLHEAVVSDGSLFARIDMLRISQAKIVLCEIKSGGAGRRYARDAAFQLIALERTLKRFGLGCPPIEVALVVPQRFAPASKWDRFANVVLDPPDPSGVTAAHFVEPPPAGFVSALVFETSIDQQVAALRETSAGFRSETWRQFNMDMAVDYALRLFRGAQAPHAAREIGWKCKYCPFHNAADFGRDALTVCWGGVGAAHARGVFPLYRGQSYRLPNAESTECRIAFGADKHVVKDWLAKRVMISLQQFGERRDAEGRTDLQGFPSSSSGLSSYKELTIADLDPEAERGWVQSIRERQIRSARSGLPVTDPACAAATIGKLLPPNRTGRVVFFDVETIATCLPIFAGHQPYDPLIFHLHAISIDVTAGAAGWDSRTEHSWTFTPDMLRLSGTEYDEMVLAQLRVALSVTQGARIFHWGTHEKTVIRRLLARCAKSKRDHPAIEPLAASFMDIEAEGGSCDLLGLYRDYAYHPAQRGSFSIKAVLPAVLEEIDQRALLRSILVDGLPVPQVADAPSWSPYGAWDEAELTTLHEAQEAEAASGLTEPEERIGSGTEAIRAFLQLRCPPAQGEEEAYARRREALRAYCRLDTVGTAIIWNWLVNRAAADAATVRAAPDKEEQLGFGW